MWCEGGFLLLLVVVGAATSGGIYVCGFVSVAADSRVHDRGAGFFFVGSLLTMLLLGGGMAAAHGGKDRQGTAWFRWSRCGRVCFAAPLLLALSGIAVFVAFPGSSRAAGEYAAVSGVVLCLACLGVAPLSGFSFHVTVKRNPPSCPAQTHAETRA